MGNRAAKTLLIDAASSGDIKSVQRLVEQGMDVDTQDNKGRTPLVWATWYNRFDVVQYLIEQGAAKDVKDKFGYTPLKWASQDGYLKVVKYLIEQGADKETRDMKGRTPLMWAAWRGRFQIVHYLVEQGADKHARDENRNTPLMWAAQGDQRDVVRYLVEQGADKDTTNKNGKSALVSAALNANLKVVRYLVEQGVDIDKQDNEGRTPLIWAAEQNRSEVVKYLIEQGASSGGQTAVLWAAQKGNLDAIQNLVQNGADPTGLDNDGNSVLLLLLTQNIVESKLRPVAKLLLENGTPPLQSNNEGLAARSIAKTKGFNYIAALVKEYTIKPQQVAASRLDPQAEDDSTWFIAPDDVARNGAALGISIFGVVYPAMWSHIDVVVKEVSVVTLRRFMKDVNTWRNLCHGNAVPFYGANHREKPYFTISEYATKGARVPYLKRENKCGRSIVWRKLKEVTAGLHYLHRRRIVHGNLKGNNVVVNGNGTAMLTDFGLSFLEENSCSLKINDTDKDKGNNIVVSNSRSAVPTNISSNFLEIEKKKEQEVEEETKDTLAAMVWAPEFSNMAMMTPTSKSDVYSLGIYIIEAVTLKNPWSGYNIQEIRQLLRNGEFKVNKPVEMTNTQWELVKQMITDSPDDRPDLSDVLQQLEVFAEDEEMDEAFYDEQNLIEANRSSSVDQGQSIYAVYRRMLQDGHVNEDVKKKMAEDGINELSIQAFLDGINSNDERIRSLQAELEKLKRIRSDKEGMGLQKDIDLEVNVHPVPGSLTSSSTLSHQTSSKAEDILESSSENYDLSVSLFENLVEMCMPMEETRIMCERVLDRLQVMQTWIIAKNDIDSRREYAVIKTRFHTFLMKYNKRTAFERLVSTHTIVGLLRDFHVKIDLLETQISGEVRNQLNWVNTWKRDKQEVEANWIKLCKANVINVLDALPDQQAQEDALLILTRETTSNLDTYSAESRKLLTSVTQTIIRQSAASVPVVPGWFIPEHEVQREINHFAQGSFGKVYRGTWRNEKVVIKCVKEYSASSEQDFSREARVWLRAQHPNVVRFFGACHLARPCFFVCEEVTNGNLADFLKKTKGSDRSLTWRLLRGAALGLQCLHQNQIVHGDLKCNQILVSEDLTAKLTDFGMSFVSMKSRPATTSGAVRWKAPELLISEGKAPTFASDVYSFGMCVVEAVSGSVPWQAHLPNIAVVYHLTEKKKFLSRPIAFVNDEQWEFVLSLCSFDPSQRLCLGAAIEKIEKFVLHEEQAMNISAASIPYDRCIT